MRTRLGASWVLLALALALPGGAQVPQFINYQGRLIDGATLVNGNVALSLRLYAAPTGGPILYEDSNTVSVVDGLYSTHIGDNTVNGTLAGALTNAEVWLEVAVNGTALSPRERMTSVAYALVSQAAQTAMLAQGVAAGAITGSMISSGAVQGVHLAVGAVGSAALATGAVGSAAIAEGAVTTDKMPHRTYGTLLDSPPLAGHALAPVAPDRFVTAGGTNSAFLRDRDGNVLATFANVSNYWGSSAAEVGTQQILVGCKEAWAGATSRVGAAYLYSLDGTLLNTITNPVPELGAYFGTSVAAVGDGAFVVGSPGQSWDIMSQAGSVYLFATNGALMRRIDSPSPFFGVFFGNAVAGVGPGLFVVGAPYRTKVWAKEGEAYLYDTNGTRKLSIPNPSPHDFDYFGKSVAGVGREHLVVGGGTSAYLFSTNGSLLVTITNQGASVFGIASNRFLVLGTHRAGIYDTTGTLLVAITNSSEFGTSATAVGADRIAVADPSDRVLLYSLDEYADGLIAEGVWSVSANMLADGAVTQDKLAAGSVGASAIATGAVGSAAIADGAVGAADLGSNAVTTAAIAEGAVTAGKVFRCTNSTLLVTSTNRGSVLASVAPDRFAVAGAADRAYLCDYDGAVRVAFTNANNSPGDSVAEVGTNYVVVGSESVNAGPTTTVGVVYLSSPDGTLLKTVTNPVPQAFAHFGCSVAGVGDGAFVVGAYGQYVGLAGMAGCAFLFNTNGALMQRVNNPSPHNSDYFGTAVAGVGSELFVVGSPYYDFVASNAGAVYLFGTNGTLRVSIENPMPHDFDRFGSSVAGVGRERFVVGGGNSAFLFSTNGSLLVTITNQGSSVFGIAPDKFLVVGGTRAGLYDTLGTLLVGFTNSTGFGTSAAAVGSDRIAIAGAGSPEKVYLYSIDEYADGLVAAAVRNGSVSANMLADGAVTQDKLAAGSVGASAIAARAGGAAAAGAVGSVTIADGMVSNVDIAVGTITGDRIVAGTFVRVAGDTMTGALTNQQSVSAARFVNPANPVVPATGIALGGTNNAMASTASFGFIGGGAGNTIEDSSTYASVGGGQNNRIEYNSDHAFIGGGIGNLVPTGSQYSVIGGGYSNRASPAGVCITIGGGDGNTVASNSDYSTIGGGIDNSVSPDSGRSTIGGGSVNTVGTNSDYSTIAGGLRNAIGDGAPYAFAAGRRARANHPGAFVWGDSTDADVTSVDSNSVTFRCQGGVRFLNSSGTLFAAWSPGAASWTIVSDRAQKEGIEPVDPKAVLEKVAALPISEWNYTGYPQRHIGPMAQDLHAAFPLGDNDKAIDSGDLPGIALAAIQGLKAEVGGQRSEIESLKAENEKLKALVEALKARLEAMEAAR